MEDDRLPYIQIHDKLGIVEIRADDARSGNWLTRITYLLEILGSESWCCLNEGRTPSTRGEATLIQSCSTTRSDKRVRISPVPRSAEAHFTRKDVKRYQHFRFSTSFRHGSGWPAPCRGTRIGR